MHKWKKNILASTLVLLMAMPIAAYAETSTTTTEQLQGKQVNEHGFGKVRHATHLGPHRQMYLTLLAEKFSPDSVDEWEAAFAERKKLTTQWKALHAGEEKSDVEKKALKEQFKQLAQDLNKKVESGELTKEQMKQQLIEWRDTNLGDAKKDLIQARNKEELSQKREQFKQLHEEFDTAIEFGDADKIKAVLPKLLEQVKATNLRMAEKLKEKKR